MRTAFVNALIEMADSDPRVVLLTGDLGFMVVEPYVEKYPDRFINVGVAEQNMLGVAAGLAESGFLPFAYSIVTFASMRPYEFFRNGAVLQHLPVRIAAIGGGFEYGHAGPSHWGLEDVAVMRVHPSLNVLTPADGPQAASALKQTWDLPGPVYYRLGKNDKYVLPGLEGRFRLGRAETVRNGSDVLFIAMGAAGRQAVEAADLLAADGVSSEVVLVGSMNPAPVEDLLAAVSRFSAVVTVEAHYVNGGLGSLVSETIAEAGVACRVIRRGVSATPDGRMSEEAELLASNGLSPQALAAAGKEALIMVP